jgi:hypothetical protein
MLKIFFLSIFLLACDKSTSPPPAPRPEQKKEETNLEVKLPRVKPQIIGKNETLSSNLYRLTFIKNNPKNLSLKEIEIWGVQAHSNSSQIQKLPIKAIIEKWFDQNVKNHFQYEGNLPLSIELSLNDNSPFTITEIQIYPFFFKGEENTPSDFHLEIFQNKQWQIIFTAQNLISDYIDIWMPHLPTRFVIQHPSCGTNEEVDHLGVCQTKKITCFDIQNLFNEELHSCSLKIENEEIFCVATENKNECRMQMYQNKNISYCDVYKNFLINPQSRLEIYFQNKKIFEQFCSTPIQ